MRNTGFRALGVSAALTLLTACGGSFGGSGPSLHASARIDPAARGHDLLYATSIYNCNVYAFTYPRGKLSQTIDACGLGFGPAFGLCTDKGGDVFMTMGEGFSIFKFAHGGAQPCGPLQALSQ